MRPKIPKIYIYPIKYTYAETYMTILCVIYSNDRIRMYPVFILVQRFPYIKKFIEAYFVPIWLWSLKSQIILNSFLKVGI